MQIRDCKNALETFDALCDYEKIYGFGHGAYVPSYDPEGLYVILRHLDQQTYLELGSVTGKMTMVAALAGYRSFGIEYHAGLVKMARELELRMFIRGYPEYRIVQGSYYLDAFLQQMPISGDGLFCTKQAKDIYDRLGLRFSEADVIYAFPWPHEQQYIWRMFSAFAGPNATLVQQAVAPTLGKREMRNLGLNAKQIKRAKANFWLMRKARYKLDV